VDTPLPFFPQTHSELAVRLEGPLFFKKLFSNQPGVFRSVSGFSERGTAILNMDTPAAPAILQVRRGDGWLHGPATAARNGHRTLANDPKICFPLAVDFAALS
jgi:hypothetical protein